MGLTSLSPCIGGYHSPTDTPVRDFGKNHISLGDTRGVSYYGRHARTRKESRERLSGALHKFAMLVERWLGQALG